MQIIERGNLAGVAAGFGMGGKIVNPFTTAEHAAPVADRFQIFFTCSEHDMYPLVR